VSRVTLLTDLALNGAVASALALADGGRTSKTVTPVGAVGDTRSFTATTTSLSTTLTGTGFTSADNRKTVAIPGAGTLGVAHVTPVTFVNSTTLTMDAAPALSVSAVTGYIGTDDTTAFQTMRDAITASRSADPSAPGFQVCGKVGWYPPGAFLITSPEAMMTDVTGTTDGYNLTGSGDSTHIICAFSGALLKNYNDYIKPSIEGITFVGASTGATLIENDSSGTAQAGLMRSCTITGIWGDMFTLGAFSGTANGNDSWVFDECRFYGGVTGSYVRIGATTGLGTPSQQDQFIAYEFTNCYWTCQTGCDSLIRADYGGCITVTGGSMVLANVAGNSAAKCFHMPANNPHLLNTQMLHVNSVRFEPRHATSKIIDCAWLTGQVVFDTCMSEYAGMAASQINATFDGNGSDGAKVSWRNCNLFGKHEYKYRTNEYLGGTKMAEYSHCAIGQQLDLQDFIVNTDVSGIGAFGSRWVIDFYRCRGAGAFNGTAIARDYDIVLNWKDCVIAKRGDLYALNNNFGVFPQNGGTWTWTLPLFTEVKTMFLRMDANGANAATTAVITITDGDGTVLWTFTPGTAWNLGFNSSQPFSPWRKLDTDTKRKITMTVTGINANHISQNFFIETIPGT
jgi:hypothetical protein